MSLVLRNKGKGMQRSSEQPLVGEERYVTTLITAAKETKSLMAVSELIFLVSALFAFIYGYFSRLSHSR